MTAMMSPSKIRNSMTEPPRLRFRVLKRPRPPRHGQVDSPRRDATARRNRSDSPSLRAEVLIPRLLPPALAHSPSAAANRDAVWDRLAA